MELSSESIEIADFEDNRETGGFAESRRDREQDELFFRIRNSQFTCPVFRAKFDVFLKECVQHSIHLVFSQRPPHIPIRVRHPT
jgi:hypothetical protein